jgi:hypothetical protein
MEEIETWNPPKYISGVQRIQEVAKENGVSISKGKAADLWETYRGPMPENDLEFWQSLKVFIKSRIKGDIEELKRIEEEI